MTSDHLGVSKSLVGELRKGVGGPRGRVIYLRGLGGGAIVTARDEDNLLGLGSQETREEADKRCQHGDGDQYNNSDDWTFRTSGLFK